jgi:hypothetical protein
MRSRLSDLVGRAVQALRPSSARRTPASPPSRDIEFDGVTVEYSPSIDGDADPGEVVWTWVPYEDDPSQGKDRPVLIVGRRDGSLVGVALTSKHHTNEHQVPVGTGSWDREGRPSYAKVERVLAVDATRVRREGAVLDRRSFDEVVAALRHRH